MTHKIRVLIDEIRAKLKPMDDCKQCGWCCGPVMCTDEELHEILDFISRNKMWGQFISNINNLSLSNDPVKKMQCPLMICNDEDDAMCMIRSVRPILCRTFGVINERLMSCPHTGTMGQVEPLMPKYYEELTRRPFLLSMSLIDYVESTKRGSEVYGTDIRKGKSSGRKKRKARV
jgi:Fe-S-cluster containining protein